MVSALRLLVAKKAAEFDPALLDMCNAEKAVEEWGRIERIACAMKLKSAARAEELGLDAEGAVASASGVTSGQARRQTRLTKKLRGKEATRKQFDKGQISATQADAIADAVDANPAAEESLLELAATTNTSELITECERVRRDALDAEGGLAARQRAARKIRHWTNSLGNIVANVELEPVPGKKWIAEMEREADRMFRAQSRNGGVADTQEQRMADALVLMVNKGTADSSSPKRRGARTQIYLLATQAAVNRGRLLPGEICETADGTPVPLRAVDEALMDPDTQVTAIVRDEVAIQTVITYSRYWPKRVLDALISQGLVCANPACGATKGLQKDHVRDFAKGGPTCVANEKFMCRRCHTLKTRRLYHWITDQHGNEQFVPTARGQSPPTTRAG